MGWLRSSWHCGKYRLPVSSNIVEFKMDIPSFWFAAIDPETRELAQELRELGGGDASDFNIQVHCFVNSSREKKETQLIWPYERSIGIKDAQLAMTHPSNEAVKYYTVTCAYDLHKVLNNFDEYPHTR